MTDSILSITIRDPEHPCMPYERTGHSFWVQIFHCDFTPLFWKGVTYLNYLLDTRGKSNGFIHGQIKVPPGSYLIRAFATCKNVVTDFAMVEVGCDKTVCVNLLPTTVDYCLARAVVGIIGGTVDPPGGDDSVKKLHPKEANEAVKAIDALREKLPKDPLPPPPTLEELEKLEGQLKRKLESTKPKQ